MSFHETILNNMASELTATQKRRIEQNRARAKALRLSICTNAPIAKDKICNDINDNITPVKNYFDFEII